MAALALGCGDAAGPARGASGLSIVAGAGVTDTIEAQLPQALVVEVRDEAGLAVRGAVVRFAPSRRPREVGPYVWGAFVGRLDAQYVDIFAVDTTDRRGRAAVLVQLAAAAGEVSVEVSVPELALVDTARFTVTPGATHAIVLTPPDSALYAGAQYTVVGRAIDRYGNPTGEPVQFAGTDGRAAVTPTGTVTGQAYGRTAVVATSGGAQDTAWVSVVPAGVLAVVTGRFVGGDAGAGLATVSLDGSDYQRVPLSIPYNIPGPAWAPDGTYFVAGLAEPRHALARVALDGATAPLFASGVQVGRVTAVDVSADGQWVYFSAGNCNYNEILYRVPAAGSTPQRVSAPVTGGDECFDLVHANVSLSPDGSRAVVEHYRTDGDVPGLQVVDLATGTGTALGFPGYLPKWSPRGDRIAYVADGRVWSIAPDGGLPSAISPAGAVMEPGLAWSPDGEWLVVRAQRYEWSSETALTLLRVATGELIPLPPSVGHGYRPAWKPAP
jgi:hypothetical protein